MKGITIDCSHAGDTHRRHYRLGWNNTEVCEGCLAVAAAANRSPARNVSSVEWMHIHGTGLVPRKPGLDSYDHLVAQGHAK